MDFIDKRIAPPKSWEKFESLIRALFAAVWQDPLTQKNGRAGQRQCGVDIYGIPADAPGQTFGIQCKGKNGDYSSKATIAEFDAELAKAEEFKPALSSWVFTTTASNDVSLQEHARLVSERRRKEGRFPVIAIGWETILGLISSQPVVIREFYPEHVDTLGQIIESLKALPTAEQLEEVRRRLFAFSPQTATSISAVQSWSTIQFNTARDLGPALMGRPLGPADVAACPELPEVAAILEDLERAGSARLAGVPGAGKSICALQVARRLHDRGWRVLRLVDPMAEISELDATSERALYIIDDAHLARPALLRHLEEQATTTRWILSAHTTSDGKGNQAGTIQLDAHRAVRVIADGLRASRKSTLAAVRRADDRVGDGPFDEQLEQRLEQAEKALFPWQFCFILGGGWRRSTALADSARAASADLVLAAAAIRQLASRDARCSLQALAGMLDGTVLTSDVESAVSWLTVQRLLLDKDDLRCPHQRLAGVLLDRILERQDDNGRLAIARMMRKVLVDEDMPLAGLALLLNELHSGGFGRWTGIVDREWLDPMLARCWSAETALDIRHSCWALYATHRFVRDEMAQIAQHRDILVRWIEQAPEGACYAIGNIINHVYNTDKVLAAGLVKQIAPEALARGINLAKPLHAAEIAHLISMMHIDEGDPWRPVYLANVDHQACLRLVSTWPRNAHLSAVASYCAHFCYFEQEFGLDLIEALIPAIAGRLSDDPQDTFHELHDIVWNSLRLYDPLNIYVGKLAPTQRMRQVGRRICTCWLPIDLAEKLSRSSPRTFQSAAGLLSFVRKVSRKKFAATVRLLDWDLIEEAIGDNWAGNIGDARMLLGQAYDLREARPKIEKMVSRNEHRIATLSTHLAAIAPAVAIRHVAAGKPISLTHSGHVDWTLGAFVLGQFVETRRTLIARLLEPHYVGFAAALSQPSPTFFNEALLFLRVLAQEAPEGLRITFDHVNVEGAAIGWRNALRERRHRRRSGAAPNARQVSALLIHHALSREDKLGELARQLRREMPKRSIPAAKTMEPIDFSRPIE